jgi:hypothetical protein
MLFPFRLALRRDTYRRDDFSPNGRHSAIVNPGPRWLNRYRNGSPSPSPLYPDSGLNGRNADPSGRGLLRFAAVFYAIFGAVLTPN